MTTYAIEVTDLADVDDEEKIVYIRAIRRKTSEQTTEDIVQ